MVKEFVYKVFRAGVYLTSWNEVVSEPAFAWEINSAGGQLKVTLARPLEDYGEGTDIDFGLDVEVWVYDKENPDGAKLFTGSISSYTPVYGSDKVDVTLLSYGSELSNFLLQEVVGSTGSLLETAQALKNYDYISATYTQGGLAIGTVGWFKEQTFGENKWSQNFVAQAGQTKIGAIDVCLSTLSNEAEAIAGRGNLSVDRLDCEVVIEVWSDTIANGGFKLGEAKLQRGTLPHSHVPYTGLTFCSGQVGKEGNVTWYDQDPVFYRFNFEVPIDVSAGANYHFIVSSPQSYVYANASGDQNGAGSLKALWHHTNGDRIFQIWNTDGSTTVSFTAKDPAACMKGIIDRYNAIGGRVKYDANSIVPSTGTLITYEFKVATVLDGIKKILELSPAGYYWYVDPATSIFYFKSKAVEPTHTLSLENHIKELKPEKRIEDMVNTVYFTGGVLTGQTEPLYKKFYSQVSIDAYGIKMMKYNDSRVLDAGTAEAISNAILEVRSQPEIRVNIEVIDGNGYDDFGYDIESLEVGDVVAIRNISQVVGLNVYDIARWDVAKWDFDLQNLASMNMQIQKVDYSPDSVKIQASSLAPDVTKKIEELNRAVDAIQTANNPDSPS